MNKYKYINEVKNIVKSNGRGSWYEVLKTDSNYYLYEDIMETTDWLNNKISKLDLTTRVWYYIHNLYELDKCNKCGEELKLHKSLSYFKNTHKLDDINTFICRTCKCKKLPQSNRAKANRFARLESNPIYKQRILDTYNIFYEDEKINEWAKQFRIDKGRKPTKDDFKEFFGRKFFRKDSGRKIDRNLFALWDSYLELKVVDYLKELGYTEQYVAEYCHESTDFVRNKMIYVNNKYYQLDIYIPLLNFAIEIQDFTTHSIDSDTEKYEKVGRGYKHGPSYHKEKRNAANSIGITLIELWEDAIRNNDFKKEIDLCLNQII